MSLASPALAGGFFTTAQSSPSSDVQFFAIPRTVAHQLPWPIGFPRQEYWSGLLFPSLGNLPSPGIESLSHALADRFFITELPGKPQLYLIKVYYIFEICWELDFKHSLTHTQMCDLSICERYLCLFICDFLIPLEQYSPVILEGAGSSMDHCSQIPQWLR